MMKNRIIPVRISANDWFRPNVVEISLAPRFMKIIRKLVKIMANGLNFAIHDTITAVNPCPFAIVVVTV